MEKIYSETDLNRAILFLESKQAQEEIMLKEQFQHTYESIKPINIIKNIFKETTKSQEIKDDILNTSVGLATGFISKIAIESFVNRPLKKIVGNAVMFSVKNVVAKNPEVVKLLASGFLKMMGSKKKKDKH